MSSALRSGWSAVGALLLAGTLSACGGHTHGGSVTATSKGGGAPGPRGSLVPFRPGSSVNTSVLTRAIEKTQSATSGRFAFSLISNSAAFPGPTPDPFKKDHAPDAKPPSKRGAFDQDRKLAEADVDLYGIHKLVVDGRHMYLLPRGAANRSKSWQEVPTPAIASTEERLLKGIDPTDPMRELDDVKPVGKTATAIKSSILDGVPVVRYRARFDLEDLLSPPVTSTSRGLTITKEEVLGDHDASFDVWIDAKGFVRRFWFAASFNEAMTLAAEPGAGHPQTITTKAHRDVAVDVVLTHLDQPASIEAPSPDEVLKPITVEPRQSTESVG